MAVDALARLNAAKSADLASTAAGKGASLVALPFGGSVGDLGGSYKDAVFATAQGGVELAHAQALATGKSRVIVNGFAWVANGTVTTFNVVIEFVGGATLSANGYALNFTKGFRAHDMDSVFSPADARLLTFPTTQRLTPFHYGAKGDYVSSASPGTDDGNALNAWASELCWRVMPPAKYGTTKTIFWNGDTTAAANSGLPAYFGIRAEPGAEIVQRTDNTPVMTFYGYRGEWRFPKLSFMTAQPATNYSAVGLLCATKPGFGNGFYIAHVPFLHVENACCGVFFPRGINSALAANAAAGATTITVADAQTDHTGARPWTVGMYVQIYLDTGAYQTTRIANVAGAVLTLADALIASASNGARVAVSPTALALSTDTAGLPVNYQNTFDHVYISNPSRYGWVDTGNGTQNAYLNRYVTGPFPTQQWNPANTLVSAIHELFRNGDKHGITNIEHFKFSGNAWYIAGDNVSLGTVHFEACRLTVNATGLIAGPVRNIVADIVQLNYCAMLSDDAFTAAGIFSPTLTVPTSLGGSKGIWRVGVLHLTKNMISRNVGFVVRDTSANQTKIEIGSWQGDRDAGIYPTMDQISSSPNLGTPVKIGNLLPDNTVAFRLDADLTLTTVQDMYPSNKGQFKVSKLAYMWASKVPATATAGVYNESGAVNLVSAVNNTALSGLTSKTGAVLEPGLHANETSKLRVAGSRLFFKCLAAESAPTAVTGASSYLTGRDGGSGATNLGFINFGAAHGFNVGDVVTITGSVTAALNATFKIVDVPTTTQITVYVDSVAAVGSSGAPTADAAIAVQLKPTVNVFALGDDYGF